MTTLREIAFDTETTGLDWAGDDRIVEVGAVELINHIATGRTFHTRINPRRSVSEATIRITGITDDMLVDQPFFEDPSVAPALLEFFGDSTIVAHNAGFDRGFLNAELKRCGMEEIPEERWVDTAAMARKKFPGAPASLDALCRRFSVNLESRSLHGALLDSQLLSEVYLELLGGRARAFDFAPKAKSSVADVAKTARQRPTPLPSRLTEDEKRRHAEFVAHLSDAPLWTMN